MKISLFFFKWQVAGCPTPLSRPWHNKTAPTAVSDTSVVRVIEAVGSGWTNMVAEASLDLASLKAWTWEDSQSKTEVCLGAAAPRAWRG